jgi:hypothetical protein
MHITRSLAFLSLSLLLAALTACTNDSGAPAEETEPNAGWITIDYVAAYPDEAYLNGEAFISPTWYRCCSGSAEDTGVTVTWTNLTTNTTGPASQFVTYNCVPLIGCYLSDHYWSAYVPIVAGNNRIRVTASDPSGNVGNAEVTVAPGPPPPDTTPPTVTSTAPQDNETNVGVNMVVTAVFSESMDPASISAASFILLDSGGTPVPGSVTYADTTATYTPDADLNNTSQYTVRITQAVQDLAGNPMASDYTWSFITGVAPDTTPPTVTAVNPKDNELCADPSAFISASFSESIDAATATASSFIVNKATGDPIPGTVWANGSTMYFNPSLGLAYNSLYTATVTTDVMDLAGNAMSSDFSWNFTTQPSVYGSWQPVSEVNEPQSRSDHTAIWTGTEMIIWGGSDLNTGGRYNPATDSWQTTSTTGAPTARSSHTAVWTGSEMIVWGGRDADGNYLNTGASYNPVTDSWQPLSTTNAPTARSMHTAVWTGSEMIVWGGWDDSGKFNTGGRYDPITDTWQSLSTTNAPDARYLHTAVWSGSEMIIWGGYLFNTGGRYDPVTDTWQNLSTNNAPGARYLHTAVWTGSEMIIWGGAMFTGTSSGGIYDPVSNSWRSTSQVCVPSGRYSHTAVWSGTQMIIWGGILSSSVLNSGGVYDLSSDTWHATSFLGAPLATPYHTAIWTGTQMITHSYAGGSLFTP